MPPKAKDTTKSQTKPVNHASTAKKPAAAPTTVSTLSHESEVMQTKKICKRDLWRLVKYIGTNKQLEKDGDDNEEDEAPPELLDGNGYLEIE